MKDIQMKKINLKNITDFNFLNNIVLKNLLWVIPFQCFMENPFMKKELIAL